MKPMSPWQFTLFRILFGLYLAFHFVELTPYATELFSASGLLKDPTLNPTAGLFPNPLALDLPGWAVTGSVAMLAGCALLFAAGLKRNWMAVILWFGWSALFHRNNLISNPSIPYIGLLLLLSLLIPGGEPLNFGSRNASWAMPKWVFRAAWILLAAGYTFSGYTKLFSPSWVDGTAMSYLLQNPLARPGLARDLMIALPDPLLKVLTWGTLAAELTFAPLAFWRTARPWLWLALVSMHLGIVLVVNFTDLTVGMLMIHAFTFDPEWLRAKGGLRVMAYDGDCLMCSKAVRFFAREDRQDVIRFATLQSEHGRRLAAQSGNSGLQTMLVEWNQRLFARSDAALVLLEALGGIWAVAAFIGRLVPRRLRDSIYTFVAQRRHQWFRNDACTLVPVEVTSRLL
jgi:predicted DCC family thiol-disulfide oxidoreductase YuxK